MASQLANATAPTSARRPPPPALNPESPALVQPWKDFVQRGWISSLKVEFTPVGQRMICSLGEAVVGKPNGDVSLGQAKEAIMKAGLWSPKGTRAQGSIKKEQARPAKSLVKADFADGPLKLAERTRAVAQALTDTTARGRIGSLKLFVEGADSFEKWWSASPNNNKVRLFVDQKRYKELNQSDFDLFGQSVSECPFRGSVPTPTEEEDDPAPAPSTPPKASQGTKH